MDVRPIRTDEDHQHFTRGSATVRRARRLAERLKMRAPSISANLELITARSSSAPLQSPSFALDRSATVLHSVAIRGQVSGHSCHLEPIFRPLPK
jgi:hypothetical protein